MVRGARIPITREGIVARALSQLTAVPPAPSDSPIGSGQRPIHYRLPFPNGGDDPTAPGCWAWAYGGRTPVADCIGQALWSVGIDRKQPGFTGPNGGWLDCPGVMFDAQGAQRWFAQIELALALPGDLLVNANHIGVLLATPLARDHMQGSITRPALAWSVDHEDGSPPEYVQLPAHTWDLDELEQLDPHITIDCSTRHNEQGLGLGVGIGASWSGRNGQPPCIAVRRTDLVAFDPTAIAAAVVAASAAAALVLATRTRRIPVP